MLVRKLPAIRDLLSQHVRRCPQCSSDNLHIVADDGMQIQRLEIEE
jgi:hydrogenase nickel incorporation protein HypA/HybF